MYLRTSTPLCLPDRENCRCFPVRYRTLPRSWSLEPGTWGPEPGICSTTTRPARSAFRSMPLSISIRLRGNAATQLFLASATYYLPYLRATQYSAEFTGADETLMQDFLSPTHWPMQAGHPRLGSSIPSHTLRDLLDLPWASTWSNLCATPMPEGQPNPDQHLGPDPDNISTMAHAFWYLLRQPPAFGEWV